MLPNRRPGAGAERHNKKHGEMDREEIRREAASAAACAVEYRRHIHKHPELSFKEEATGRYVAKILEANGIGFKKIAGTGILARIEGHGDLKNAVVLRADMDALPVHEATGREFASCNEGVMHACGHDMHTAALLAALTVINKHRDGIEGTLFGLFQPGEEINPGGASLVLKEKPFEGYNVRAVVGEHVDPDLPTGVFGFREGKYMASSDEVRITVKGEGGHAAMPHKLKDPVVAAAAIVTSLQQVVSRDANPDLPTVLSIGRIIADGSTNVIPDSVFMAGTFRTFDEEWRAEAKKHIRRIAESTADACGVEASVDISTGFPSVVNDTALTSKASGLIAATFGQDAVVKLALRPTAEDFGFYTQLYPSLFYRFGVGGRPGGQSVGRLHTAQFDPDEKALEYAVAGLLTLAFGI